VATPDVQICVRCILPATFPGLSFDDRGECSVCQAAVPFAAIDEHCAALRLKMDAAIEALRGHSAYDCIVAFSGGKDSSYTLKLLVERYRLRCLAVTVDNGFMSDQARANALAVTGALGVDHEIFRPAPVFMNRLYLESARHDDLHAPSAIRRASNMCSSCIGLINTRMLNTAAQHDTSLVAGGYIGGQVPKDAAMLQVDLAVLARTRAASHEKYLRVFGPAAERFFALPATTAGAPAKRITIINPMLTVRLTESQIVDDLAALGWTRTTDTGENSTNCRLNDLGILVHHRRYGFHPYLLEMADQVRAGLLDREAALRRARAIPDIASILPQARQLGLDISDLG